ncbi:ComF family protein [Pedobacter cryoconitis]|uniref:ComF family protein n=1 Tax=Pedobacter cryoconitis TaxID=188932 RepID=A0A7W9DZ25_9SPHI|nr:phosphoribosyltransferase family protein [Pedobacter cryoconitis]MBB5636561.1 ComF family protein [Pedobacter cryoconitis]
MSLIKQLTADFFHLLFPECCNACGTRLFYGEKCICIRCLYDLPYTDFHLYPDHPAAKLFWGRLPCQEVMALLYFKKGTKAQNLIHQLKYKGQIDVGFMLGLMIGEKLLSNPSYQKADLIIPVPLHRKKENSRGYNQSKSIADGIAKILQLPVVTGLLIRQTDTFTQTKKSRYSRFENMQSVFKLSKSHILKNQHVLLIDDVITTGATLEACGKILLDSGLNKLSIAAAAYAE